MLMILKMLTINPYPDPETITLFIRLFAEVGPKKVSSRTIHSLLQYLYCKTCINTKKKLDIVFESSIRSPTFGSEPAKLMSTDLCVGILLATG
jgi:hypothetical protein